MAELEAGRAGPAEAGLRGKVVLVSGAARPPGMGCATARLAAEAGAGRAPARGRLTVGERSPGVRWGAFDGFVD